MRRSSLFLAVPGSADTSPNHSPEKESPRSDLIDTPKKGWEYLNWQEKKKAQLAWLLRFLTLEAKFEALLYSLSSGIITAALAALVLSHFPPLALLVLSSLAISGLTSWFILFVFGKKTNRMQKALIIISTLALGGLFAVLISFSAIPVIGVSATLAGAGFLIAATNAALYLMIGLSISLFLVSSISTWKLNHQLASESTLKNAHSLAKQFHLTPYSEIGPRYSFSEKLRLCYGFAIASSIGLATGTLCYFAILQLVPMALASLGLGLSISGLPLIALAITFAVITALIISKQVMANFISLADQDKKFRLNTKCIPSLLNELLEKNQEVFFFQQPLRKLQGLTRALWQAYFSFSHYERYQKKHYPNTLYLTKNEFRARNFLSLTLLLAFCLIGFFVKPLLSREYKAELQKSLAGYFFWKNPLSYSYQLISTSWSHLLSYQNYNKRHPESPLSAQEFYIRNFILFVLTPVMITLVLFSVHTSTLGSTPLEHLLKISRSLAITINSLSNAVFTAFINPLLLSLLGQIGPKEKTPSPKPKTTDSTPKPSIANMSRTPVTNTTSNALQPRQEAGRDYFTPANSPTTNFRPALNSTVRTASAEFRIKSAVP